MNQIFKIVAAFLLFFLFILLPPFAGLSSQGQRVIAVVLLAIILWATEALPVGITSVVILILLGITKSVPSINDLFHGFLSPIVGIVVDAVVLYPVQTATNLLAYETGLIGGKDVLKVGLGLFVLTALVILYIALPWWSLLGVPLRWK